MSDSRVGDPARSPADDSELPERKVIRLPHYDYGKPGQYFLTICVHNRECRLGRIQGETSETSPAGEMVESWWHKIPDKFPVTTLDAYVVMPNHIHGIICIHDRVVGATPCGRPPSNAPEPVVGATPSGRTSEKSGRQPGHSNETLFQLVSWFKTMTTNEYMRGVKSGLWPRFDGTFWQRGYYENVVESDEELNSIRDYIRWNPRTWTEDAENPENQNGRPK